MSQVITTLLIIFIIFIAIMLIWIVIRNVVESGSRFTKAQAQFYLGDIKFYIVRFGIDGTNATVTLKNLAGKIKTYREGENATPPGVDVVSVVDVSGSMHSAIGSLKGANLDLVDTILGNNLSKVGLVAYSNIVKPTYSHDLTNNKTNLQNVINGWGSGGNTCICCGVINATERFQAQSSNETSKAMIVMSDGQANVGCGMGGGDAQDAITAACNANSSLENFIIYSVGLGSSVDEATLQAIAQCGNGQYFNATTVDDLIDVYEFIAQEIQVEVEPINPFSRLLFIFYNNTNSVQFRRDNIPAVLEIEEYFFDLQGLLTPLIIRIEVYPVIIGDDGEEIIGPLLDSWERR